jgi:hypothetical protein
MTRGANKRSGCRDPFPVRLHDMMAFVETECLESATIGWVLGGRGFIIHNSEKLVEILPLFFGSTKYKPFLRQVNMWDFERMSHGLNKGTYTHPYFVRGNRDLCFQMSRQIKPTTTRKQAPTSSCVQPDRQRQVICTADKVVVGSFKSDIADGCRRLTRDFNGGTRKEFVEQDNRTRRRDQLYSTTSVPIMEDETPKIQCVSDRSFINRFLLGMCCVTSIHLTAGTFSNCLHQDENVC